MSEFNVKPQVVPGQDAELIQYPDDEIRVTKQPGGSIQVAVYRSSDREGSPLHSHPWDEVQVVVDGFAEFRIADDDWTGGGEGTVQFLPSGIVHSVRVPNDEARLIQVSIGAPYDGFAKEMARLFAADAPLEDFIPAAARHGVRLG